MVSKAVQERRDQFSPEIIEKMHELARLIRAQRYPNGLPMELTWDEIETMGHEVGSLCATEFDQGMQREHAELFDGTQPCPQCGKSCAPSVKHRDLLTRDGTADLSEPEFHCRFCERSFFPSANST
ncbi:MAG: hypothetical protein MI861_07730 [Pirellulales bacterium]|nr:hypothetical protein [Pirellulales bacterium]